MGWQEWQGSNLRPPVLETGALPIELHSYGPASPLVRPLSSTGGGRFAREKRKRGACSHRAFRVTVHPEPEQQPGNDHERSSRREAENRRSDAVFARSEARNAGAVAPPSPGDVGCLQA